MKTIADEDLAVRYRTPVIRGARIARLGEQYIGPVASDAATCRILGEEQIGWFIGGVPTYDRMIELVHRIDASQLGGRWVVVPATRCLADVAYQIWMENSTMSPSKKPCLMWHSDQVTFCVPEQLNDLYASIDGAIAGIILLDPNCIVHRGRSFGSGKYRIVHDRPQLIVDFRAKLAVGQWSPPLMIMSLHKAAAVATDAVARIYGLEAMNFVEGSSLRCGEIMYNSNDKTSATFGRFSNSLVS